MTGCPVHGAAISNGDRAIPYETAVGHPEYNDGRWVIVEGYDTREQAAAGHKKWLKKMTSKKLPSELVDCANAEVAQLPDSIGDNMRFPRKKK